jgi:hypothetical protein
MSTFCYHLNEISDKAFPNDSLWVVAFLQKQCLDFGQEIFNAELLVGHVKNLNNQHRNTCMMFYTKYILKLYKYNTKFYFFQTIWRERKNE